MVDSRATVENARDGVRAGASGLQGREWDRVCRGCSTAWLSMSGSSDVRYNGSNMNLGGFFLNIKNSTSPRSNASSSSADGKESLKSKPKYLDFDKKMDNIINGMAKAVSLMERTTTRKGKRLLDEALRREGIHESLFFHCVLIMFSCRAC